VSAATSGDEALQCDGHRLERLDAGSDRLNRSRGPGAFGVLCLLTATSIAVIRFFTPDSQDESAWRRLVAPRQTPGLAMTARNCDQIATTSSTAGL
jgi:hypothetical protein